MARTGRLRRAGAQVPPPQAAPEPASRGAEAVAGEVEKRRPRRPRTPPPAAPVVEPVLGGGQKRGGRRSPPTASDRPRLRSRARNRDSGAAKELPAPVPFQPAGAGSRRRTRTPPHSRAADAEKLLPRRRAAGEANEGLAQLRLFSDFFHNPLGIKLNEGPLEISTSPQEARERLAEVQYQLSVLKALETVLTEELKILQRILPEAPEPAETSQL